MAASTTQRLERRPRRVVLAECKPIIIIISSNSSTHTSARTYSSHNSWREPNVPWKRCASIGGSNRPKSYHRARNSSTLKHANTCCGSCQGYLLVGACARRCMFGSISYVGFYFVRDHGKHRSAKQFNSGCMSLLGGRNTSYTQNHSLANNTSLHNVITQTM